MSPRHWLLDLYHRGLEAVHGRALVASALGGLEGFARGPALEVLALGKAAAAMAAGAEDALGPLAGWGVSASGDGPPGWEWRNAGHPLPDLRSLDAGESLLEKARSWGPEHRWLLLLSGGTSALVAAPVEGLSLQRKAQITRQLLRASASIHELNCLRKHLSRVKGGGFARSAWPALGWTLALSDVSGDRPESIGSGPSVEDTSTLSQARAVIDAYQLDPDIHDLLQPTAPLAHPSPFVVLASNQTWTQEIARLARADGVPAEIDHINGSFEQVFPRLCDALHRPHSGLSIFGGEPTLEVKGPGQGGRMQHIALALAEQIQGREDIWILAAASDGVDGPTSRAGALIDGRTWTAAPRPSQALRDFDSASFHLRAGSDLAVKPTGTNVCDVILLLHKPPKLLAP